MFSDPPLTKRQLGWLFVAAGAVMTAVVFGVELLHAGRFNGIGPVQRQLLAGAAALTAFGLTLVPLGNKPA